MKTVLNKNNSRPAFKPEAVEIEITQKCTILCANCAIKNDIIKAKYSLSEKKIKDFLNQAKENKIYYYSLTGGEPFIDFYLLKSVVNHSPCDLIKINTNGYIFSSPKKTKQIFQELKDAGFPYKNKKIKVWLNISIGQQNIAGVPIENSIFACNEFYNYFSKERAGISLIVFSASDDYSMKIIDEFISKYRKITGKKFNHHNIPIKLIPSDGRNCSTALIMNKKCNKRMKIKDLINYYSKRNLALNCSSKDILAKAKMIAPRILLRADGSVYTCSGYSHVFKLGNIKNVNLKEMLKKANKNLIIRALFKDGLKGLLKLAKEYNKGIGDKMIPIIFGPCDICRMLRETIEVR